MKEGDYIALSGDITVVFHYAVGELFVRRSQLGTILETERNDRRVRVQFPRRDHPFDVDAPLPPGTRVIGGSNELSDADDALDSVEIVQVQVDIGRGLGDEGPGNAEFALMFAAEPIASAAVRELLDWARTLDRQPWLSPTHMTPELVGPAYLMNQAGEMTHGYGTERAAIVMLRPDELPTGDMRESLSGTAIPEAESLLAEARWAVWPTHDPDSKRAVLFAAIALEVKTPQVLLAAAHGTTRGLLQVVLDRFDETPVSVNFQLNEIAEAIVGTSLKSHDGNLAKKVTRLYMLRGAIAHRGKTPDVKEAREMVIAAERVFDWLNGHASP